MTSLGGVSSRVIARLEARLQALYNADPSLYSQNARYLIEFITQTPALRSMIENAERDEVVPSEWVAENFRRFTLTWPDGDDAAVKVQWSQLKDWAAHHSGARMFALNMFVEDEQWAAVRLATDAVVAPLVRYLTERLDDTSEMLYLMWRYAQRLKRFDQERLYSAYEADTLSGEDVYDLDLQRFLFDQGIDQVFAKPRAGRGEVDIVAEAGSDDPLCCEVKLFTGDNKSNVRSGFGQALDYADDWTKTVSHLVVVNLSDSDLEFDSESESWPPRLTVAGVTVYIVVVEAKPGPSPSEKGKKGPRKVEKFTRDYLTTPAEEEAGAKEQV